MHVIVCFPFKLIFCRGILISCSNNAIDTVVHSHDPDDNTKWVQWELEDTGRAELPLEGSEETYPAGMALDLTSQQEVHVSDTLILPPSPLLLLLSDHGVLCPFTVVNKKASAAKLRELVRPPKPLPSDPRLVRQQKPVGEASPPTGTRTPRPSAGTSTARNGAAVTAAVAGSSTATTLPQLQKTLDASGFVLGQQKSVFSQPGFSVKPTTAHPPLGSMTPHSTLAPRLSTPGQSVTVGSVGQRPPLGSPGQGFPLNIPGQAPPLGTLGPRTPLTSQLSPKTGQTSSTQQQPKLTAGGLPLGGSGTPGSGLPPPSSFPFSVSSLASSSSTAKQPLPPSSATTTMSSVAPQQLPQSLMQPAAQQSSPNQATLFQGLRFAPGYPPQQQHLQQQCAPVVSQMGSPLPSAPSVSGQIPRTVPVSLTQASMPHSSGLPSALHTSAAQAVAVGGGTRINFFNQSMPSQPGQLPIRPLQSSTPLAHPHLELLPPAPPPVASVTQQSLPRVQPALPGTTVPPSQPSPLLSSMAPPLAAGMSTPRPHGNTPLLHGHSVVSSSQPQRAVLSYQMTHPVGVRPPMAQRQSPNSGSHPQPPAVYFIGAQAQGRGPALPTGDYNEVCEIVLYLCLLCEYIVRTYMCACCVCLSTPYPSNTVCRLFAWSRSL